MRASAHISSLLVDLRPGMGSAQLQCVCTALAAEHGVQVHAATPQGRLIVTVTAQSDQASSDIFARIGALDGVMSVALVYHQLDLDPEADSPLESRSDVSTGSASGSSSGSPSEFQSDSAPVQEAPHAILVEPGPPRFAPGPDPRSHAA